MAPQPPATGKEAGRLDRLAPLLISGMGGEAEAPRSSSSATGAPAPPASQRSALALPRLIAVGHPTDPLVTTFLATRLALALREQGKAVRLVDGAGAPWFRDTVVAEAEPLPTLTPGAPPPADGWGEVVVVALPAGSLHPYLTCGGCRGVELIVAVGEGREELTRAFVRLREGARLLAGGRLGVTPLVSDRDIARTTFHRLARACRTLLSVEVVSDGYLPVTATALRRAGSAAGPEAPPLTAGIVAIAALVVADGPPPEGPGPAALASLLQPV